METVSKRMIAESVARKTNQTQLVTKMVIQKFLDEIIEELAKGSKLEFRDFGIFEVVMRKPRVGRNPQTGDRVPVSERRVVRFRMGRLMRERIQASTPAA